MIIKLYEMQNESKESVLKKIADKMVENNIATKEYYEGILLREKEASFYIGNYVAIPHSTNDYIKYIKNNGLIVFRFINPINWDNNKVHYVIGIAAKGDNHMNVLENIANSFSDEEDTIKTLNIKLDDLVKTLSWN